MKKLLILLVTIILLPKILYSATYTSKTGYSGYWESDSSWVGTKPGTNFTNNNTININGKITLNSDLTFSGNNNIININSSDTLIILGDLTMNNNSTFTISDDGVLIVLGDLTVNNRFSILSGGKIIVLQDFNANNNTNITTTNTTSNIYVLGTINSNDVNYIGPLTNFSDLATLLSNEPILTNLVEEIIGTPLPIELLYFKCYYEDNKIIIEWSTASEYNNDYFTIYKSYDGMTWGYVNILPSIGVSSTKTKYSFYDEIDMSGLIYYKLRQTDYNGLYEEFDIISINVDNENIMLKTNIYDILGRKIENNNYNLFITPRSHELIIIK